MFQYSFLKFTAFQQKNYLVRITLHTLLFLIKCHCNSARDFSSYVDLINLHLATFNAHSRITLVCRQTHLSATQDGGHSLERGHF